MKLRWALLEVRQDGFALVRVLARKPESPVSR
jgi:hypothetical protein